MYNRRRQAPLLVIVFVCVLKLNGKGLLFLSQNKKILEIERKAMSRIPEQDKQNWYSIAFIQTGAIVCVPALMVGGILASSMTFREVIISAIIGYAVLALIMSLMSIVSSDMGIPSTMASTKGFGDRGASYVSSIIFFIGCIGWFGVQTAACAMAFCTLMSLIGIAGFPVWLAAVMWGLVMLITSVAGFSSIKWLNYITAPFLLLVCAYGGWYGVDQTGVDTLFSYFPAEPLPLTFGVSLTVGSMAVGAVISGDYARYSKSRGHTVTACFCGVLPTGVFMFTIGSMMAICVQETDIVMIFAGLGLPILSMLVLIIATWTTNMGNAYTAGLAVMKISGFKDELRPKVTFAVGILGILLAISGLANAFVSFLSIISAITPAVAGVVIADYWIIGKGKPENWYRVKGFNWIGILSWIIGSTVALFFSFFSQGLDSIITTIVVYVILFAAFGKTKLAGQGRIPLPGEEE